MLEFRVIDLQTETIDPEPKLVKAQNAEQAAELALGLKLARSGTKCHLRARVYFQPEGQPLSMVRLYTTIAGREER